MKSEDENIIKLLLDRGADPNLLNENGLSPLHHYLDIDNDNNIYIMKLLLDAGTDSNLLDNVGNSLLHYAVDLDSEEIEVIELLLKYEANPNLLDDEGESRLNTSILDNRLQTCRLLLQYEADPNLQDPDGYSALHIFLQQVSLTNVIPEREILDVIKILLDLVLILIYKITEEEHLYLKF